VIDVENSVFDNNTAWEGGAVATLCTRGARNCLVSYKNTNFTNNRAVLWGGALYYPWVRPVLTNIVNINNQAPYGENIGSYAVKFTVNNS